LVGKVPDPKSQVEQITNALIYKYMDDMDRQAEAFGGKAAFFVGEYEKYSWRKLMDPKVAGQERMNLYVEALDKMATNKNLSPIFRDILKGAFVPYRSPETLDLFLHEIDGFAYEHSEELGNAYEYLLSIMGAQGDAGQFRTPRHIIDFIVEVVDPQKGDKVHDPACGTAGFLISAYKHILGNHDGVDNETGKKTATEKPLTASERKELHKNFVGYDISPEMVKLSRVNMFLHSFPEPKITEYDTLSDDTRWGETFDVILANPPFMSPKGGIMPHKRFGITATRAEVLFTDYIIEHLTRNGRAGIIVPEGIIFQSGKAYKELRKHLVEDGLYAVVSLPSGVFNPYAGVKTSILLFDTEMGRKQSEILFVKVSNDGYDLGAQRRPIDKNDLPEAARVLKAWRKGEQIESPLATWVSRERIAETGDYNLSGDRYKMDLSESVRESLDSILKTIEPYRKDFESIVRENNEQAKKIQDSIRPFIDQIQSQQEIIKRTYAFLEEPIREMQKFLQKNEFSQLREIIEMAKEGINKNKWPMVELGEVCDIVGGGTPSKSKKAYWENGSVKWLSAKHIQNDQVVGYDLISENALKESATNLLPAGSVLLITRVSVGKMVLLKDDYAINQDATGLITKEKLNSAYLFHVLHGISDNIINDAQGVGVRGVTRSYVAKIKIPLPPIEVQERIVAELDGYQNIISGARQVVDNWKPKIDIDPEWKKVKLGEVCDFASGGTPSKNEKKYWSGDIPWASSKDMKIDLLEDTEDHISELATSETATNLVDKGTVLGVVRSGILQHTFPVALTMVRMCHNQDIMAFVPDKKRLDSRYLLYIFESENKNILKEGIKPGVTVQSFFNGYFKQYIIPLPPLEIQKQIVEKIESERALVESNMKLIEIYEQKMKDAIGKLWD